MNQKGLFLLLCVLLLAKALLLAKFLPLTGIGFSPDEAQYWTWSQFLDWGYYSKPPGIAWEIWLGTHAFGNNEFGVRFGAIIIGFLIPLAVYALARACKLFPTTAFWAGLTMALCPIGIMASFLATTDGGFILFWTLACAALAYAVSRKKEPNPILIGFLILCGALFKWPIYLFWLVAIPTMLIFNYRISYLKLLLGIAISLLGLLPSVIWNYSHDWATFRHVFAAVSGGPKFSNAAKPIFHGNFWDFIAAQAALLSPLLFILLFFALIALFRNWRSISGGVLVCGVMSTVILIFFALSALFQKMQGNWALFMYPSAIVVLCWYLCEYVSWGNIALKIGLALSVVLSALVLSIPYIQSHNVLPKSPIPYAWNPFHHNIGWEKLPPALTESGYDPTQHFLFSDKYQMTSILSFYSPQQKLAYFLNISGARKNQFSYWPSMAEEQKGKTGYFVWVENAPRLDKEAAERIRHYEQELKKYFRAVRFIELKPLFYSYGKVVKAAAIFECQDYNGKEPAETLVY